MFNFILRFVQVVVTVVSLALFMAVYACMLTPPDTRESWPATQTAKAPTATFAVVAQASTNTPTSTIEPPTVTASPPPTRVPLPPTPIPVVPTAIPLPTDTPPPAPTEAPTVTSVPAPPVSAFVSGGLGLDRAVFEQSHIATGTDILGTVYDNQLIVTFQNDIVWHIARQWSPEAAITPGEAELIGGTLIPFDAVFVNQYNPAGRPETTVRLYMSESLKGRFVDWGGGEPGNLTVQYNSYDGRVTRLLIAPGNNPSDSARDSFAVTTNSPAASE